MLAGAQPAVQPTSAQGGPISGWLAATDLLLVAAGLVLLGAWCVRLVRGGSWRQPLAGIEPPSDGAGFLDLLALVGVYGFLQFTCVSLALAGRGSAKDIRPGSHTWHLVVTAGAAVNLASAALALWLLYRRRPRQSGGHGVPGIPVEADPSGQPAETLGPAATPLDVPLGASRGRSAGWPGLLAVTFGAFLVAHAATTAQLSFTTWMWQQLHPVQTPPMHELLRALHHSEWGLLGAAQLTVVAVIVAAVSEEVFFRGLLLQVLWRYTGLAWPAILLTAVCFGFIHAQPQEVLPLITLGAILGYLRVRHGSLLLCIAVHALFNGRTMVYALLAPELLEQAQSGA